MPTRSLPSPASQRGLSLLEIAVVLVIISVLLGGIAAPIAAQLQARRVEETRKLLEKTQDALYGFAAARGRLPCPATAASKGVESPIGGGACTVLSGLVPAATLGIAPVDDQGFLVDAWADGSSGRRIGYAVSDAQSSALTTDNGIRDATMNTLAAQNLLFVCAPGLTGTPPVANCGAVTELAKQAPAIVFSRGRENAARSSDELNNQNGDRVFTSGTETADFDDLVAWLSLNTLFDRMLKANRLP